MAVLEFRGLQPQPGSAVDLTIRAGECVCLSGPSGAGKTLLLRAAADLDPHHGTVLLDGRPAEGFRARDWRRHVGLLPAEAQWWSERIGDHFETVDEDAWRRLGFSPATLDWDVTRASTGERQRLALLRLLANRPRALLLDEPTASLDPDNVAQVEALLAEYRNTSDTPVLWVSHDPAQVRRVADRHFRIEAGRLTEVTP